MGFLNFMGPLLRMFQGGLGTLADSSDKNPKTSASLAIGGGLMTLFGFNPDMVHSVGNAMCSFGSLLTKF